MAQRRANKAGWGLFRQKGFFQRHEGSPKTMTTTNFRPAAEKSGLIYAMVGFLVLLLAFVAVTFFLLTRDSRLEQEWVRLSSDLQVHSQQLAKSAAEAVEGNRSAFVQLSDWAGSMSEATDALKSGSSVRNLPALPVSTSPTLPDLDELWTRMSGNTQSILERETLVLDLAAASNGFIAIVPEIQELTDKAIRELTRTS